MEANQANTGAAPQADAGTTETALEKGQLASGEQPSAEAKAQAREAIRKLKIDDQEVPEDEVLKVYKERTGHQKVANKTYQEGLKAKKQAEEFVKMLKTDPLKVLSHPEIGHDVRKLAEQYLAAQLEDEMLDPRERELKQYKSKLEAYEAQEKKKKEDAENAAKEEMRRKFSEDYSKQFVDALKTTGLPPTKNMVAEMAKYIKKAADLKFEMTAVEAAKLVKEDMEQSYRNLYGEADAETLVKLIGEQGLQKVRTYDTSRLKDPAAALTTPVDQEPGKPRARDQGKRMTPSEWRAFNRK